MFFLPEFNLIKNVRHGAVEIHWTDILRKELITGTLILHLCAPFVRFGCCPVKACAGLEHARDQGTMRPYSPGCRARSLCRSEGTLGELRGDTGCWVLTNLLMGWKNLSQCSVRIFTFVAVLGSVLITTSAHYILTPALPMFSFLLSFFFFVIEGSPFFFFFQKRKNCC